MEAVNAILDTYGEPAYAEMESGEKIFFHPLVLHASDRSTSGKRQALVYCSSNARLNAPIVKEG
ncbi:hypothetical protein AA309_14660 [Microvirga vignae]|uniref:Phytanoyl-CoA dioxygenase n=1 Tax=Microvirga vignae TaxID=1225564 RepID=A0A0H1RB21_9HYPH|nr:hypothetical protein [Microvirga vignae]KLK92410.1 hypothetical protein AA309_14660 [Microvirga vignae]